MRTLLGILAVLLVIALSTELLLRLGIALDVADLDDPANYAQPFCEDDFHKLRFLWWKTQGALKTGRHDQHPRYGWVQAEAESRLPKSIAARPHVAVFGDSFMAGAADLAPSERIASQLQSRLAVGSVADYSVVGYGLDQIYLRFTDVIADPDRRPDVAVVGILLTDIDRVVETFRAGPKPYFRLRGESLQLSGVPIELSPEDWLEQNPPSIRSYALAMLDIKTRPARGFRMGAETDCLRPEKQEISRRLLRRMVEEAQAQSVELIFVLNYSPELLSRTSWRETFLRQTLDELGATYVDSRRVVEEAVEAGRGVESDFFLPAPNNHYSASGNSEIVASLLKRLSLVSE